VTKLEVIDPRAAPAWEEFVASRPDATAFHTTAWASALADTYPYQPRYYVAFDDAGKIIAGIPTMLVRSRLTGTRIIGLPFSDFCAPLLQDDAVSARLVDALREDAERERCRYVELRGDGGCAPLEKGFQRVSDFVQHEIDLDRPIAVIQASLHRSARRGIRKAEEEGVKVRLSSDVADLQHFYRLHVPTRRKHGLPPTPYAFFCRLHRALIAPGHGCLLVAEFQGRIIAVDICTWHRDVIYGKFQAWDTRFRSLGHDLLLWHEILLGKERGCVRLNLGRSSTDNEGLRSYKSKWGAEEHALPYLYYPELQGFASEAGDSPRRRLLSAAIRHTPSALLPRLSAILYGHFA